jgi:hypothetical protein
MQQLAVHLNVVPREVGFGAQLDHRLPVHRDPALQHQRLRFAPARHPRARQDFLQPFLRHPVP